MSDEPRPWTDRPIPATGDHFSFVLVSDRTGGARPGVFERGLATVDLLAPAFAIQLGDLVEGYTEDLGEIERQWAEIDAMITPLRTRMFHVAGNHDVANPLQQKVWRQRYGPTWYHLRHADVLFVMIDTQDPEGAPLLPPSPSEGPVERLTYVDRRRDREVLERNHDWHGTQPATLGPEQLDEIEAVLSEHRDVRWTVLCMHMPLWQGDHPAWQRIRRSLGDRAYTAFAGHVHNYRHDRKVVGDRQRSHIRLGPTGGLWVVNGPEGNFDHVTQVTMTETGPVVANVLLEGVRDVDGQPLLPVATRVIPIF